MPPHTKRKKITEMPLTSRPRERLVENGRENLTTVELVAILCGTGTAKKNAISLAETILRQYPLEKLREVTPQMLTTIPGVGISKASRITAAIELGERLFAQHDMRVTIRSTPDAVHHLREYANKQQEYLLALYLNARHELLQKEIVGMGTLNSMLIEPKDILRHALTTPCASIIIAHNHPSGDPTPSEDDIRFTKRLFEAGELMGITLLDHLVISKTGYYSFRNDEGK